MLSSAAFSSLPLLLLLLLIPLIFFITSHSHLSHKPPPSLLKPLFLHKEKPKDDLAYFFSAFLSSEGHIIVLLVGHTSLKGESWWCQIVRGEECFCSVQLMGIRNFQSQNWAVQRLECKFKLKREEEVNSIRLRRSGQSSPFLVVSDPIFWGFKTVYPLDSQKRDHSGFPPKLATSFMGYFAFLWSSQKSIFLRNGGGVKLNLVLPGFLEPFLRPLPVFNSWPVLQTLKYKEKMKG